MIEKIIGLIRKNDRMARAARMAVPAIFLISFSLSATIHEGFGFI